MSQNKTINKYVSTTRTIRRNDIIDASIKIFSDYGLDGSNTRAIAKQAGVSQTLLYKYFKDKDEIIHECTSTYHDEIQGKITKIIADSFDNLDVLPEKVLEYIDDVIDICRFLLQVIAHPIYSSMMKEPQLFSQDQIDTSVEIFVEKFHTNQHTALGAILLFNSTINEYILKKSKEKYFIQMDAIKLLICNKVE